MYSNKIYNTMTYEELKNEYKEKIFKIHGPTQSIKIWQFVKLIFAAKGEKSAKILCNRLIGQTAEGVHDHEIKSQTENR